MRLESGACAQCWARVDASGCQFVPRPYRRGTTLFVEGEVSSTVWVVKTGLVALLRAEGEENGAGRAVAVRGPRSIVGIESLIASAYRHTATIAIDARLCAISSDRFAEWMGPKSSPAYVALAQEIQTSIDDERRIPRSTGSATRHVIDWLLGEMMTLPLETPREIVADLLGIRPETLSRILAKLARSRAIELSRTSVKIRDRELLAHFAE